MSGNDEAPKEEAAALVVDLHVISPSAGANQPLNFPGTPASTTVQQLKEKIRQSLPLHPLHDQQRLIHRGRMLARDTDTLRDVFGVETLRAGGQQTLHLVLRENVDHQTRPQGPTNTSPAPSTNLAPGAPLPADLPAQYPHVHAQMHHRPQLQYLAGHGLPMPQMPVPVPGPAQLAQLMQHQHQQQQQHQAAVQSLNQLYRDNNYAQILFQQQRERAMMGVNGVQANGAHPPPVAAASDHTGSRNAPTANQQTQTVTREVIGPNGQYFRITVNENVPSSSPQPAGGLPSAPTSNPAARPPVSAAEFQNMLRASDATQATQAMTDAMHRSASGASLASMSSNFNVHGPVQPIPPGVTTPIFPAPMHASRTATPDSSGRPPNQGGLAQPHLGLLEYQAQMEAQLRARAQAMAWAHASPTQPEVYILNSPAGPRGLLINHASEIYISPAVRQPNFHPYHFAIPQVPRQSLVYSSGPLVMPNAGLNPNPPVHAQPPPAQHQAAQPQPPPAQPQAQAQVQIQPQAQLQQGHAANAPAHGNHGPAVAALAGLWPPLWLLIRLLVFVWWFTASDTSWTRWCTIVAIAVTVFMVNTGVLNGAANEVLEPVRRHLEGLLPRDRPILQGPAPAIPAHRAPARVGAHVDGGAAAAAAATARHTPEPNAAQAAARLLAERRNANGNWLLDQVRRVERAGVLFLASIAPGVAERHIAEARRRWREEDTAQAEARAAAERATQEAQAAEGGEERAAGEQAPVEAAHQGAGQDGREDEQQQPLLVPA